jgi:uncharacterized RDD family membrane protein YckC
MSVENNGIATLAGAATASSSGKGEAELIYVGFWRRLAAYALDFAILVPYALVARQLIYTSRSAYLVNVILSLFSMSDLEYATFTSAHAHVRALEAGAPAWYQPLQIAGAVWVYGEFLVLLTNRKRRALHDFMACTVVIEAAGA